MALLTPHWTLDVIVVLLSAFFAAYLYMTRNFDYWKKRGVLQVTPTAFLGNFGDYWLLRRTASVCMRSLYEAGKGEPYIGFYIFDRPALILRDPDFIKRMLVKDFSEFSDRYVSTDESDTIGCANMFLAKNPKSKNVRARVSPIFTSGKMKNMFLLMAEIGDELVSHLDNLKLDGDWRVIEIKSIFESFATDVITSCAFGLQVNSLNDPDSVFRKCGTLIFGCPTYKRSYEFAMFFFAPFMVKLMKLKFFSQEANELMRNVFYETTGQRLKNNTKRNDLIDLLIEQKKSQDQINDPQYFKLEGDALIAQAATFFGAGFETSSGTMSFSLYELALHPEMQSRLREEMNSALADSGGEITYDMVMNLPYLDMFVSEILRKYPSLPFLDRVAARDYKVPDHDLIIEEGTPIYVPLLGLHYDPEHFPDPEKFDPERFSRENKKNIRSGTYLPFGEGPHNCIGLRFGLLVSKLGILKFIKNYEVTRAAETPIPMEFEPNALLLKSAAAIFLNIRRIVPAGSS